MSIPLVQLGYLQAGPRTAYPGTRAITGATKIEGALSPCKIILHTTQGGMMLGSRESNGAGQYSFTDLAEGEYFLVIRGLSGDTHRGKVEHINVT